jgi:DNA-binding Lrp family transcriptional regulator
MNYMTARGPEPTVKDEELLTELNEGQYPFDTATSLSDRVGLSRQRTRKRLNRLSEDGTVARGKVSGVVLYWLDPESSE